MGDFLIIPCLNCIKITQKQVWRPLIYFAWMKSMYFREYVCRFSRKLHYFCILGVSHLNSLGPSDATWWHRTESTLDQVMTCCLMAPIHYLILGWLRTESTLDQVMTCCLMAPSHYLNQCWLIISKVLWHSSEGNFIRYTLVLKVTSWCFTSDRPHWPDYSNQWWPIPNLYMSPGLNELRNIWKRNCNLLFENISLKRQTFSHGLNELTTHWDREMYVHVLAQVMALHIFSIYKMSHHAKKKAYLFTWKYYSTACHWYV